MSIFASISRLLIAIFFVINIWPRSARSQQLADEKADLGSLRFVHVVWRHGDRSPSRLMPTDMQRNPERKWKLKFGGLSQLTERGALQHFRLGQMLRRRYAGFLAETYAPEEFAYRSSAYNRTQMSALANQQGMFALPGQQLHPQLPLEENAPAHWHIRFLGQGHDPVVFDDVHCSVASAAEDRLFNGSSQFREAERENADFLQLLAQKSGFLGFSLRRIYWLHDYLNAIFAHLDDGFSPPEWANDSVRAEVFRLYNLKNSFDFKSHLLKRLWAGPLFTEMLERMANVSTGSRREGQRRRKQQKFHAYSGHDLTVAGTLAIFGIYPEVFPKFATAILVELHQQKNIGTGNESAVEDAGVPFVRLFHKNETEDSQLWELEILDCGGDQQQSDQQSDQPGDQQGDQQGDPQAADLSAGKCTLEKLAQSRRSFLLELAQWARECLAVEDEMESG